MFFTMRPYNYKTIKISLPWGGTGWVFIIYVDL